MKSVATCLALVLLAAGRLGAQAAPIPIKVVIVTTFEEQGGPDASGLSDGEASRWIAGLHLNRLLPLRTAFHPLRLNDDGVLLMMTGCATARAAASTMALGLDPRFDLSKSYWLLAGIAGVDPLQASQGSAAWAEWVIDGDLDFYVDEREIPASWPDGHVPWNGVSPFSAGENNGEAYQLNPALVHWAFALTRHTPIPDSPAMAQFRSHFVGFPQAQRPPFVLIGDNLACATYWQGTLATRWARRWVKLYTGGQGKFVTASCEDAGFMQAMAFLAQGGKVDWNRVLVLRTASDYSLPRPGVTSADSLRYDGQHAYLAADEAFQSAYVVGRVVVDELLTHWPRYRDRPPSP